MAAELSHRAERCLDMTIFLKEKQEALLLVLLLMDEIAALEN